MKRIFKILMFTIFALILCAALTSCGGSGTDNSEAGSSDTSKSDTNDSNVSGTADAEITDFSVGYLTESAYNNGNYAEESITETADFESETALFMVIDLEIKTRTANAAAKAVKVAARVSALSVLVQEAPTGKIESVENTDGSLSYDLYYTIPSGKNETKDIRMILKLIPNNSGDANILISVSGDNHTSIKGETSKSTTFPIPSSNLKYTLQSDRTYRVSGMGNCTDTDVIIPSTYNRKPVTSIASAAFSSCTDLKSIVIPHSVTSIGNSAFRDCSNLTSISIPDSVTSIGNNVFYGCSALTEISVNKNNGYFRSENGILFNRDATKLIHYPAGKTENTYIIPDSVTNIGNFAFADCTDLLDITIPDGVTIIGNSAFSGCSGLTDIIIPKGATSIGFSAFYHCIALESITLPFVGTTANDRNNSYFGYIFGALSSGNSSGYVPESLKTVILTGDSNIDDRAFFDCIHLRSITIQGNTQNIGDMVFSDCICLKEIFVNESNAYYCSENGVLFNKAKTHLVCYPIGKTETSYSIPADVTSIGDGAFYGCSSLTSISIPDGVTSIGYEAFWGCTGLTSISIPSGVTSIGYGAFWGCTGLTSISIPDDVTSIGDLAFYDCSSLTSITFGGTTAQWSAIERGEYWNYYIGKYTVTCTDGTFVKN